MSKVARIFLFIFLILLAIIWLLPLYAMLTTSFKTLHEVGKREFLIPPLNPNIKNYFKAFSVLYRGLFNSITVSLPATGICIFIGSWGGYFLSMFKFKYAQPVFFLIAIVTFLPYQIVLIPFTQFMVKLNLFNTHLGLMLAYVILNAPMAALILAIFFNTVPAVLQEAAALDGCGPITFYWKILLPVSLLGIVSTALLTFTFIWNEFLMGLTLTQGPFTMLATPLLAGLKGNYAQMWHIQMAGATLTSIPPLVVFIVLGKYFIRGLVAGTLKG